MPRISLKTEQDIKDAFERTVGPENVFQAIRVINEIIHPTDIQAAADYLLRCYNDPGIHTLKMVALDSLLGTHGVDVIGPVDMRNGAPLEYLNPGDPYVATLLWIRDREPTERWQIGCWGDYVNEQGEFQEQEKEA